MKTAKHWYPVPLDLTSRRAAKFAWGAATWPGTKAEARWWQKRAIYYVTGRVQRDPGMSPALFGLE